MSVNDLSAPMRRPCSEIFRTPHPLVLYIDKKSFKINAMFGFLRGADQSFLTGPEDDVAVEKLATKSSGKGMIMLLVLQSAVGLIILVAMIFAPPRSGEMMILPLVPRPIGGTVDWIIRHDGRIVGRAGYGHGLVIFGRRDALALPAITHGALLIAAPASSCGPRTEKAWR